MFSCEFCESFKNISFQRTPAVTASVCLLSGLSEILWNFFRTVNLWSNCKQVLFVKETFSREYFVSPNAFLVGISWSKIFSRGYFKCLIFFLVANFVIKRFSVVGCRRKRGKKKKYINTN